MKLLANLITLIFNPVVFSLLGIFLITYRENDNLQEAILWTAIAAVFVLALTVFMLVGIKRKIFKDIDASNKNSRIYFFLFSAVSAAIYFFIIFLFNGPIRLLYATLFSLPAILFMELINTRIKASIHMASVTFLLIGLGYFFNPLFFALLAVVPIVAWARIKKKRHTKEETIAGITVGTLLAIAGIIVVELIIYV